MINFNLNHDEVKMLCFNELDLRINGKEYTPDELSKHMYMMPKGPV